MLADLRLQHGSDLASLRILDLGCGSGSNLRAIAPLLGARQQWTLIDYDQALLGAARVALKQWAHEVVSEQSSSLQLVHDGLHLSVHFQVADLSNDIESVLTAPVDLVTASALFDLVSREWVERFCKALSAPLYAVLSFDGEMSWLPEHALDSDVVSAFAAHQTSDKGFGAALGPDSSACLSQALENRGYDVVIDKSPWVVDELPSAFHGMLVDGVAQAVIETGRCTPQQVQAWLKARRSARSCLVGHDDLYASRRVMR